MATNELVTKLNELTELRKMAEDLNAEIEAIQEAIKAHMTEPDSEPVRTNPSGEQSPSDVKGNMMQENDYMAIISEVISKMRLVLEGALARFTSKYASLEITLRCSPLMKLVLLCLN